MPGTIAMPPGVNPYWDVYFYNREGTLIDFSQYTVMGRMGDFGTMPFNIISEQTPDGSEALASAVQAQRGQLVLPLGIETPETGLDGLWNLSDWLSTALRAAVDDDVPNAGWFIFGRRRNISTPDVWRIPAIPQAWKGWQQPPGERGGSRWRFKSEVAFTTLSRYWEDGLVTRDQVAIKAIGDATWSTYTWTEIPGGDGPCWPTFYVDGPASGTITSVSITNNTTGKIFALSGIALTVGQVLIITSAPFQTGAVIGALDVYPYRTDASHWFPLRPTANSLTITKNATSQSGVRVTYRRRRSGF